MTHRVLEEHLHIELTTCLQSKGPITIAIRLPFDYDEWSQLRFDCVKKSGCRHRMLLKACAAQMMFFYLSRCRLQKINNFWTNRDKYGLVVSCCSNYAV